METARTGDGDETDRRWRRDGPGAAREILGLVHFFDQSLTFDPLPEAEVRLEVRNIPGVKGPVHSRWVKMKK